MPAPAVCGCVARLSGGPLSAGHCAGRGEPLNTRHPMPMAQSSVCEEPTAGALFSRLHILLTTERGYYPLSLVFIVMASAASSENLVELADIDYDTEENDSGSGSEGDLRRAIRASIESYEVERRPVLTPPPPIISNTISLDTPAIEHQGIGSEEELARMLGLGIQPLFSAVYSSGNHCLTGSSEFLARQGSISLTHGPASEIFSFFIDNTDYSLSKKGMLLESNLTGEMRLMIMLPNSIPIKQGPCLFPNESDLALKHSHYYSVTDPVKILRVYNSVSPPFLNARNIAELQDQMTPIMGRHRALNLVLFRLPNGQLVKLYEVLEHSYTPASAKYQLTPSSWNQPLGSKGRGAHYCIYLTNSTASLSYSKMLSGFIHRTGSVALYNCALSILAHFNEQFAERLINALFQCSPEIFANNYCNIVLEESVHSIRQCNVLKLRCHCVNDSHYNLVFVRQSLPKYQTTERICSEPACIQLGRRQGKMIEQILAEPKRDPRIGKGGEGSPHDTPI